MNPVLQPATFSPAPSAATRGRADRVSRLRPYLLHYAWAVVGWNVLVVLWGAVVRATGSGAGCGNHWPLCNGQVIPQSPQLATVVEFIHRAMTGGATLSILLLLIWTFRALPGRHLARAAVTASAVFLVLEALLGALLVKLGYVVHNESMGRFIVLPVHLANTLLLLASLTLTAHYIGRTQGFMRGSVELRSPLVSFFGLAATLLVGVSGSLAALGDTLFPAATLRAAFVQDLSSSSSWLLRLRWVHPAAAVIAGLYIGWLLYRSRGRESSDRQISITIVILLLAQLVLGAADVVLLAPTWMQIIHLLGADLLWIALILLTARLTVVPIGCPHTEPVSGASAKVCRGF
ncbi:MAG TPA: COX15/CtaA family protein [Acidisarcina sp.]